MRKFICLACVAGWACVAGAVEVDGIAARVDAEVILKSDIVNELHARGWGVDRYAEARNELIARKLILKAAADAKMSLQTHVVEGRIQEIIRLGFDGDRNKLMTTLARQRLSYPEWRQRTQDDMVVGAMRYQMVDRNVSVSPAAVREEYARHPERYAAGGKVTVSVILLSPAHVDLRAEVSAALRTNDFAAVARRFSDDSRAAAGGRWEDVTPADEFRPEVCDEIARLPCGATSQWIEIEGWSFLVRKEAESPARARTLAEAYDDIERQVRREQSKKLYAEWIERLKAASYLKVY